MLTPHTVEAAVYETVRGVAAQRGLEIAALGPQMRLVDELGLKSLDVARLIAMLELKLGLDPFSDLVPVTNIRTVGDLCGAYLRALKEGQKGGSPLARSSDYAG